jgi:uncharacterized protein (TIGR01615 family)
VLLPTASDRGAWEHILVDVDFRSAFEVARPTKAYWSLLQRLPVVFVGKGDGSASLWSPPPTPQGGFK